MYINSGIYGIFRVVEGLDDKVYIGSSINTKSRWQSHLSELRRNKHHSRHLQNAWNKYGEENFTFIVLEIVEDEGVLFRREQFWIDYYASYNRAYGYNILPAAGSNRGYKTSNETKLKLSKAFSGEKNPFYGKKHSEETRELMSRNHADINGSKNPFYGKQHTQETKDKISQLHTGRKISDEHKEIISRASRGENSAHSKLKESDVLQIIEQLKQHQPMKQIARDFNVTDATISVIRKGEGWKHLTGGNVVADSISMSKINFEIAEAIRERHLKGESRKVLAKEFDLDECYLGKIIRNERWKK